MPPEMTDTIAGVLDSYSYKILISLDSAIDFSAVIYTSASDLELIGRMA